MTVLSFNLDLGDNAKGFRDLLLKMIHKHQRSHSVVCSSVMPERSPHADAHTMLHILNQDGSWLGIRADGVVEIGGTEP